MTDYRIEYSIQRQQPGENDFTEIGFGSSGTWPDVAQCAHMVESDVTHLAWETSAGMPDPESIGVDPDAEV